MTYPSHLRRGMTLVELMVVVAIIGLLAVTVLPALSATAELRRGREAARMVSSFIAKAQSRAIGRREWSGFQLIATGSTSFAALDLVLADVPPMYRGDTVPALLTISGSTPSERTVSGTNSQLLLSGSLPVLRNDLIRFNAQGPWYELSDNATTGTSLTFRIRGDLTGGAQINTKSENVGQNQTNTPWPSAGAPLSFEILRQPISVGSPLSLPEGRVVDLYWSGFGPPLLVGGTATYRRFETVAFGSALTLNASAGATTSILFDGTGRARQIQVKTAASTDRLAVTGPIFLLIGRADRVVTGTTFVPNPADDSIGANWQYPDSHWVAIDPQTGIAKSAECMASGTTVIESQLWIRRTLLAGGN